MLQKIQIHTFYLTQVCSEVNIYIYIYIYKLDVDVSAYIYKPRDTDENILGYIWWLIIHNVQLVTSKQCLKIYISELENSKIYFV